MQLALFDLREPVKLTRADELSRDAEAFLAAHPDFWRAFVKYAHDLVRAGREHYSAKAIVERIRWDVAVSGGDDFKVNNSHVAIFARVFAATYPESADLFAFRERVSALRPARLEAA